MTGEQDLIDDFVRLRLDNPDKVSIGSRVLASRINTCPEATNEMMAWA